MRERERDRGQRWSGFIRSRFTFRFRFPVTFCTAFQRKLPTLFCSAFRAAFGSLFRAELGTAIRRKFHSTFRSEVRGKFRAKFLLLAIFLAVPVLLAAQAFQESSGIIDMDGERFAPEDPHEKAEWTFARFHYDLDFEFGRYRFQRWAADYPKSDRQFTVGVKRLTRLQTRSTEHVIDAKSDEIYDYPWLYVEDPGAWRLSPEQAGRIREYLLRGGFFMLDDSHGDYEYQILLTGIHMIFPERPIEDLGNGDEIFHVVYDLSDRVQIPGTRYIWGRRPYTPDSSIPVWRGIRDDKGRLMVAICHNSDVGDAWEWADSPEYPEREASLAYRIGINYIIYAMTH